jgi:hypothetical protein
MNVCLFALVTQHAMRMRRTVMSPVACLILSHVPHYLINGTVFEKNVTEHKMCVLIFCTTFV